MLLMRHYYVTINYSSSHLVGVHDIGLVFSSISILHGDVSYPICAAAKLHHVWTPGHHTFNLCIDTC